MKLFGITNKLTIRDSIDRLYQNLSKYPHKELIIPCGGPEGEQKINVCYSNDNQFWWGTKVELDKQKYWNPVGFKFPDPKIINRSDCEFNCSIEGLGGQAGLFAKDFRDNTYLLHSGKAGGNTVGTTIEAFCDFYKGGQRQVVQVEGEPKFFVVSNINSDNLLENIINYAKAISDFKVDLKLTGSKKK